MSHVSHLEVIPLGGLGEFGMNLMVYRLGNDCLVVDAGMMFPGAEHLGIDVVIPSLEFLEDCGVVHAVLLSHGHEDHIGAIPYLLARHEIPVYGTPYTLGLVSARLDEHERGLKRLLRPFPSPGEAFHLGPFEVEALGVAHSIPQAVLLVLRTPVGTVVHTSDFKLDPTPLDGRTADLHRLSRLGEEGVLLLLPDSTNADRVGFTPSERAVGPAIESLVEAAKGRILVTTFASNIHRIQQVADIASRHGRKWALVGSSMIAHAEVAAQLGLLSVPVGARAEPESLMDLPPEQALFLVSGSQGEPTSALARIAIDKHREVRVAEGDLVIHSARTIPGNEKSVGRMVNHLLRRGAEVVSEAEAPVHVSGHPSQEELRLMLRLLKPRFVLPIHGEYRQLRAHARLARDAGWGPDQIALIGSGDVVAVNEKECVAAGRVPVGQVFIDASLEEVDHTVLKDRRQIAGDGIVVAVVTLDATTGTLSGPPEIVTRGFLADSGGDDLFAEAGRAVSQALSETTAEERADEGLLKSRIQGEVKRLIRRRTQRRPLIIPVVVTV